MTRLITATVLIAAVGVTIWLGGWWFGVLAMAFITMAVYEEFKAFKNKGHRPVSWPTWAAMAVSLPVLLCTKQSAIAPIVVITFAVVSAVVIFRAHPRLSDLLVSFTPLFTVVLPGMCVLAIARIDQRGISNTMLVAMLAIACGGDTMAMYTGKLLGKTPLCPEVSPKKTVEGAVGGLLGSVLFAALTCAVASMLTSGVPPLWHFLLLGVVGGIAGQLGDLFASLVKRHCEMKDFSSLFPGHGGAMDRLDSILATAVVVMGYCRYVMGL